MSTINSDLADQVEAIRSRDDLATFVRDLITEAYNDSREFGLFVELAAVTGARPSQIVRLEVRDLLAGSEPRLMMPASRKGKGRSRGTVGGDGSAGERAATHPARRSTVETIEPGLSVPASSESLRPRSGRSDDVRVAP